MQNTVKNQMQNHLSSTPWSAFLVQGRRRDEKDVY